MAIAYDNALQTQVNSSVTSVTRSFTVTGSDTCVVSGALTTATADMSSITYNGASLTKVGETNLDAFSTETHFLVNSSTGANNLVWNSGTSTTFVTNATSYTGVRNTSYTPATNTATGSSATASGSLTTTVANSWIVTTIRTGGAQPNASGTNYVREASNASNGVSLGSSQSALGASSHSVSAGLSVSNPWAVLFFELQEQSASSSISSINGVALASVSSYIGVSEASIASAIGVTN